jgi:acyl-CoA synthetase (AMP-forming)/AMP-acid ligase II
MQHDPSGWRTRLNPDMIARYRTEGAWLDRTIGSQLRSLASAAPDRTLFIDGRGSLTAAQVLDRVSRLANALTQLGLQAGDVVSFQLPNWNEAVLVELACSMGGFVSNPIVPIYRDNEVGFILANARSRVLFVPETFRGFDYRAMLMRLAGRCPNLAHIIYVRSRSGGFDTLIEDAAAEGLADPDPNHVKLLLYTSGTTSSPKGVLHTHNTIDCEVRNFAWSLGLGSEDVVLMPSTLCHVTGYLYGIQMPVSLGIPTVLMDVWNAATAADLVDRYGVTFTIGATPFLQELAQFSEREMRPLPSLRLFATGGAPVPPSVVHTAERAFADCRVFRVFGSTEAPTVTLGVLDEAAADLRAYTDGRVVGHEVRLLRPDGSSCDVGEEGEIVTRGPELCVGYAWELNDAFDEDGFFHTGDLGRFDVGGCLTITGRAKDLIIRGGENISPKEIEDVLYRHAAIRDAAIVAMPHARLGETVCAFVTLHGGAAFEMKDLRALVEASGLAKQKWPERLEVLDMLPMTPSGKVRKNILRERAVNLRPIDESI